MFAGYRSGKERDSTTRFGGSRLYGTSGAQEASRGETRHHIINIGIQYLI